MDCPKPLGQNQPGGCTGQTNLRPLGRDCPKNALNQLETGRPANPQILKNPSSGGGFENGAKETRTPDPLHAIEALLRRQK